MAAFAVVMEVGGVGGMETEEFSVDGRDEMATQQRGEDIILEKRSSKDEILRLENQIRVGK